MYRRTGFPQGSILSSILLNIKSNDIVKAVLKDPESCLSVDDFSLYLRGKSLNSVIRRLQLCVNIVNKWVQKYGLNISPSKIECVLFTNERVFFYLFIFFLRNQTPKWTGLLSKWKMKPTLPASRHQGCRHQADGASDRLMVGTGLRVEPP